MAKVTIRNAGEITSEAGGNIFKDSKGLYGDQIKWQFLRNTAFTTGKSTGNTYASNTPMAINKVAGNLDLVEKHPNWTTSPIDEIRDDIVTAKFRFYQPRASSVVSNLFAATSQLLDIADSVAESGFLDTRVNNAYRNFLLCHDTNFSLNVPILKQLPEARTHQFGEGGEGGTNAFGNVVNDYLGLIRNNPGALGESTGKFATVFGSSIQNLGGLSQQVFQVLFPQFGVSARDTYFKNQGNQSWSFDFSLLNTNRSYRETQWNNELVQLLSLLLSSSDRNRYVTDSPVICSIEIPNVRFIPLAQINFSWEGEGNYLNIGGKPSSEALNCKFEVTEMIPPTRNLQLAYILGNRKLEAVNTDPRFLCNELERAVNLVEIRT